MTTRRADPPRRPLLHRRGSGSSPLPPPSSRWSTRHRGAVLQRAEAQEADMARAVAAARQAFDEGPWPRLTHAERAEYLRAIAEGLRGRATRPARSGPASPASSSPWPRHGRRRRHLRLLRRPGRRPSPSRSRPRPPGRRVRPPRPRAGRRGRGDHPVERPLGLISYKVAPALLAGCTVVLKSSPEAPGEGYVVAEVAEEIGLPPGVLNVVTADREVSELLVRDPGRQDHLHRARRRPAGGSPRSAASASPAAPWSSAASRRPSSWTTSTCRRPPPLAAAECFLIGPGLLVADAHRGQPQPPRRAGRGAGRRLLAGPGGRPVRRADPDGPAGHGPPARPGGGLHRQGRGRGGDPGHRRRAARAPRPGLVHRAHRLRQRRQLLDHRPGGDLRPGAERDSGRGRGPGGRRSPTTRSTASTPRCSPTTSTGPAKSPGSCGRARLATTPSGPTSGSRSAASSSRASAARAGPRGSCRSSRPRR